MIAEPTSTPLVVGFDLDMTLVDPRPGVIASYLELTEVTGHYVDAELAASRLGPPLELELAHWVPADEVASLAALYRDRFATIGVKATTLLPGALDALAAVRAHRGQVAIVSAKTTTGVRLTLDHLGMEADHAVGDLFAEAKGEVLGELGASIFVGDHTGDMRAAAHCGAYAVAVTTGGESEADLRAAGAHVVLTGIAEFPAWLASYLLETRLAALDAQLRHAGQLMVAFSGGADSAFLLAAAARALGPDKVVAATAISPSLPAAELDSAAAFAAALGVRHLTPRTDELSREGYRANAGDRCFFCKAELLDVLRPVADDLGIVNIATGTNADDAIAGFRPGIRAAAERGALTPLRDAGLTKAQIRAASRQWGLVTWDKPAAACLSSRIAYGVEVTAQRLSRVERAETALRVRLAGAGLAPTDLRVRDLGDRAKVEVDAHLVDALVADPTLLDVIEGFAAVEVDLAGFRSGAMNELLGDAEQWR